MGAPLSPDVRFDAALQSLLDEAVSWITARVAPPFALLLLGSAAQGEACGVEIEGRLDALSDLDLGLFIEGPAGEAVRRPLAEGLRAAVRGQVAELGLTRDPIDLGLFSLPYQRRVPPTLELMEAFHRPHLLAGDRGLIELAIPPRPAPFEAWRLVMNRIVETDGKLPAGWGPMPAWRDAYRWAKLPVDLGKAELAAAGILEPSIAAREPDAWTTWRLSPTWPPPTASAADCAARAAGVLQAVGGEMAPGEARYWRAILGAEGGPWRERLRRWREVTRAGGRRVALRWGGRAWPASFAKMGFALAWMQEAGASVGDPDQLRAFLATEIGPLVGFTEGSALELARAFVRRVHEAGLG